MAPACGMTIGIQNQFQSLKLQYKRDENVTRSTDYCIQMSLTAKF